MIVKSDCPSSVAFWGNSQQESRQKNSEKKNLENSQSQCENLGEAEK